MPGTNNNPAAPEEVQPFKAHRFLVEIEGSSVVVGAFTRFSGIKMTNQPIAIRSGNDKRGVKTLIPGITEYDHVTLSKGVIGDNEFLKWMFESVFPGLEDGPQNKSVKRNLNIIAVNDFGERGITWQLKDAMPVSYELKAMDAGESAVLTEEMEFAVAGVKRTVMKQNVKPPPSQ